MSTRPLGSTLARVPLAPPPEKGLGGDAELTLIPSSITLLECVNNFLAWSGASIPSALNAVTATPASMLGLKGVKGSLEPDADADLAIFTEVKENGTTQLVLDEVWKFGTRVTASKTAA